MPMRHGSYVVLVSSKARMRASTGPSRRRLRSEILLPSESKGLPCEETVYCPFDGNDLEIVCFCQGWRAKMSLGCHLVDYVTPAIASLCGVVRGGRTPNTSVEVVFEWISYTAVSVKEYSRP